MTSTRHNARSVHVLLALTLSFPALSLGQQLPSPESFFGFQMGADRQLARWDKMVEYYDLLGEQSDRLHVVHMGPSTWGNPFLALFISSPENLARLEQLKQLNATLTDPRGVPETEIERAAPTARQWWSNRWACTRLRLRPARWRWKSRTTC